MHRALLLLPLLASACDRDDDETGGDTAAPSLEELFAFAVIADPHIVSNPDNAARLQAAVAWVEDQAEARSIELVLVVGDIGWGPGLPSAKEMLDELSMPYLPIIGDNEVHAGSEEAYHTTFAPHFEVLSTTLDGWSKAEVPVWNPQIEQQSWLDNASFDHRGVHFVGLDWAVRGDDSGVGETGDLHDFEGGTLPWLAADLDARTWQARECIVLASHIPMQLGMFDLAEVAALDEVLLPLADHVYADFAGHLHLNGEQTDTGHGFDVYLTDATFDDVNTVRVVTVSGTGREFAFAHDVVVVP